MAGINKVILVGRVGKEPETKYTGDGKAIVKLSIATSERWTDKNTGEKKENIEWHQVSIFGKLAEIAEQYVKKGSLLYVEGEIKTNKWQDKSGNDRYTTGVVVSGFNGVLQMLDKREDSAEATGSMSQPAPTKQVAPATNAITPSGNQDFDESQDIPF